MKMRLFEDFRLKFESPDWSRNPEFGLLDALLDLHPELIKIVSADILSGSKSSVFGRGDTPSVEQIFRAAIYKELRGLDYRELEYAQTDSRVCAQFTKIDPMTPFSFQLFQKYISKIQASSLEELMFSINKIAIEEGYENLEKFRQDSTVVESNIHHPSNNSLVWDCIKDSHRLLSHLREEIQGFTYRDYTKCAKKTYYKINNCKSMDKRADLFRKQLNTFTKSINQVSNVIKKKRDYDHSLSGSGLILALERLLPLMKQVYSMTYRKEILGEKVKNDEKLFSIYELHTDIIVKGSKVSFGHKVNFGTGSSNLILTCQVLEGNPTDSSIFKPTIDQLLSVYEKVPRDCVTDGGYTSRSNMEHAANSGIKNVVFGKIIGSLKNQVSSKNMQTRLKKWRAGIEAVISNLKRGFNLFRCNWKGSNHFNQKVFWSVIAYNIRVFTSMMLLQLQNEK